MKGHGEKLTRKQEQAIAALLTETTVESAARRAGIGAVTLWRWLHLAPFQSEYRTVRRQVMENAVAHLQQAAGAAADALQRNLRCGVPTVEVQAAKAIIDQALKAVELLDLASRVEILERSMEKEDSHVAG